MLVTLATHTFIPKPTVAVLRLGVLARALAAGGDRVWVLTLCLALFIASNACWLVDGGIGVGEDSGLVEIRRAPVLYDRMGATRGYVSYMSFDLPLIARLSAGPRPDVVVSEPPPTTGVAVRIACATRRIPCIYYYADIVSDATALASVPGFVMRTTVELESFALRGARRVITVSDGVAHCTCDTGTRDIAVVPDGVCIPGAVATGALEGFPVCGGPIFVYVGTVAQWLVPEVFIDAFERIRARLGDACFVFVGQGNGWDAPVECLRGVTGIEMVPVVSIEEADQWMARAIATLASLRPGGYDYAYPTKILASLAQGTPVVYAGPGQAAHDITEGELGVTYNLNTGEVTEATVGLVSGTAAWVGAEGTRAWVSMHRLVEVSSRVMATAIRSTLAQAFGLSPSG